MYLLVALTQVTLYGAVGGVIAAGVIFGLAQCWDLWNVWVYAGIFVVVFSFQDLTLYRKSPELLKERYKPTIAGRGHVMAFIGLMVLLLHWGIAGLDQRFHWSDIVPQPVVAAALVMVAIAHGLFAWSMLVNPFFASQVRIQSDRGQRVIRHGPYAIVRHPGYVGQFLFAVASGVALNSLLAMILTVIGLPILIRRTIVEDQMLRDELAGYAEYAAKVRYRLIPGVW